MTLSNLGAKYTQEEQETIMTRSIDLAYSSIQSASVKESTTPTTTNPHAGVVLSLGPFGASLSPSQEYAGIYPQPYGPSSRSTPTNNSFPTQQEADRAEQALAKWHYDRLLAFSRADGGRAWRKVKWLAFETVPLLVEIQAIRRAVGALYRGKDRGDERDDGRDGQDGFVKPFWITSAFPDGHHPQRLSNGDRASMEDFVQAALGPLKPLGRPSTDLGVDASTNHTSISDFSLAPRADGLGINCTSPFDHANLVSTLSRAVGSFFTTSSSPLLSKRPSLVFYPDGGATYDTTTKTWTSRSGTTDEWARLVGGLAIEAAGERGEQSEQREGGKDGKDGNGGNGGKEAPDTKDVGHEGYLWESVIVGGCCKSSFNEIRSLRQFVDDHT